MKPRSWAFATLGMALGLAVVNTASAQDGDVNQIGVISSLTGRNAVQGEDILRGIRLAMQRINQGYAVPMQDGSTVTVGPDAMGGEIKLIVQDTESRPASALAATRKLVNVNDVPVILGVLSSGVCVPTGEFTNKNRVVQICAASTSPQLREIGDYHFSVMGLDNLMGEAIANFAVEDSGADSYAHMAANNPFGVGMEIQTCKTLEKQTEARCVTTVRYQQSKSDYRPDLRRVTSENPDKGFFVAYGTDAALILEEAYQLGIDPSFWYAGYPTLWANEISDTPQVGEGIKGLVAGATTDFYQSEYAEAYEAEFGEPPTTAFGGYAYDSAMLTALALAGAKDDTPEALRDALMKASQSYKGVTGSKAFDEQGMQIDETYKSVIYQDGKLIPYKMPGGETTISAGGAAATQGD